MLVSTARVLGIRCLSCGERNFHNLSLFDLKLQGYSIKCACGQDLAKVGPMVKTQYCMEYDCPYCGGSHHTLFSAKQLTGQEPVSLVCPELDMVVGFLGTNEAVLETIKTQDRSLEELARELGFVDYYENPEIIYKVLGCLYKIAESGNLSCSCGNYYIEVEIFNDRVELRCNQCGAVAVVPASVADDWRKIQKTKEIKLAEGRSQRFDLCCQ